MNWFILNNITNSIALFNNVHATVIAIWRFGMIILICVNICTINLLTDFKYKQNTI